MPKTPKRGAGRPKKLRPAPPDPGAFDPLLYLEHDSQPSGLVLQETTASALDRPGALITTPRPLPPPKLALRDDEHGIYLYHGNCLDLLDRIAFKHPEGKFDCIFADPPYFLSNGGITCHAGRMVKVDKGDWDKSKGAEINHEFNLEWLRRCQQVLKPNGTIWVSGTHHVIHSVGYAMQQLGFKILNDITWEKPNPPPNLSCRYFTHSAETIIWAAKNSKSKHCFNYKEMKQINGGKQMKSVWRFTSPARNEKEFGKHPTQKPLGLLERCILASTFIGDWILDPFAGSGTTAIACIRHQRNVVIFERDANYVELTRCRISHELNLAFLSFLRIETSILLFVKNDLDSTSRSMDRINEVAQEPEIKSEKIFHESKFVFLACAQVSSASVVHTTVDVSVQSAWEKAPKGSKAQTTHIVKCETEIFRLQ